MHEREGKINPERTGVRVRHRKEGQEVEDKTRGFGKGGNMAEPELKSRSSRESVAKARSQEKMESKYNLYSHSWRRHMMQSCIIPSWALMQLMQD